MIIPSIDIQNNQTVQLIGGKELAVKAGHPMPIARKFGRVGEIAVIDLDAAIGSGHNRQLLGSLLPIAQCRIGGGIRNLETAMDWLNAGAKKIIIGTAASVELVSQLPTDRVIVALDARHNHAGVGEIVDHGWQRNTGQNVFNRIAELRDHVDGFLITFVEREGRMTGIDLETIKQYASAVGSATLTVAGGITKPEEIAALDSIGVDAQVGMAIYTGEMSLSESFCGPLRSDRHDELWPTIVCNESASALGLVYSNLQSVEASLDTGHAHYWSRKRGLWKKGESSGACQDLISIQMDCDRDALKFVVRQHGSGFCHLPQETCFGNLSGLSQLESTLRIRKSNAPAESYTHKLFQSDELLNAKIREEASELADASTRSEIIHEAADALFFTLAKLAKHDISLASVELELDRRSTKVRRRPGLAKEQFLS